MEKRGHKQILDHKAKRATLQPSAQDVFDRMQKEGKYISVKDIIKANQDDDLDDLGNIDKLVEVYGKSKM